MNLGRSKEKVHAAIWWRRGKEGNDVMMGFGGQNSGYWVWTVSVSAHWAISQLSLCTFDMIFISLSFCCYCFHFIFNVFMCALSLCVIGGWHIHINVWVCTSTYTHIDVKGAYAYIYHKANVCECVCISVWYCFICSTFFPWI